MKALLGVLLLVLLAGSAWTVGELHKQGCEMENLRRLEVTSSGTREVLASRVNLDGSKALTLRAQFPGAETCTRWPF